MLPQSIFIWYAHTDGVLQSLPGQQTKFKHEGGAGNVAVFRICSVSYHTVVRFVAKEVDCFEVTVLLKVLQAVRLVPADGEAVETDLQGAKDGTCVCA